MKKPFPEILTIARTEVHLVTGCPASTLRIRCIVLAALTIAIAHTIFAQEYKFQHITVENGLSQGFVNCIYQDSYGFMWFGTNDGLNRYDGYSLRIFTMNPSDTATLSDNYILALNEDASKNLWIGTTYGGVTKLDLRTMRFRRYRLRSEDTGSVVINPVTRIYTDRGGQTWIGTNDGLFLYDRIQDQIIRHYASSHFRAGQISGIFEDRDSNLWVATWNRGFLIILANRLQVLRVTFLMTTPQPRDAISIRSACFAQDGTLWMSVAGIFCGIPLSLQKEILSRGETVQSIRTDQLSLFPEFGSTGIMCEGDDNRIWVSHLNGVALLDPKKRSRLALNHEPSDRESLSSGIFLSLFRDRSGLMWLGTGGNGVNKQAPTLSRFKRLQYPSALSSRSIRQILEDRDGSLWIGGYSAESRYIGLDIIDGKSGAARHLSPDRKTDPGRSPQNVWSLYPDPADGGETIWIGTDGSGLFRCDRATKVISEIPERLIPRIGVYSMFRDHAGVLWIGSSNGLWTLHGRQTSGRPPFDKSYTDSTAIRNLLSAQVWCVGELKCTPGLIWCATGRGLMSYDPAAGRAVLFVHERDNPRSLNNNNTMSIQEDLEGRVWVATAGGGIDQLVFDKPVSGGLPEPKDVSFVHHTTVNGLPNDVVYGMLDGGPGQLWMSTNKGLSRFDTRTGTFRNYDQADGLQSNEFNKNSFYRCADGELMFGGVNGLNRFYPSTLRDNPISPNVVITDFRLFNKSAALPQSISEAKELILNHDDKVFSLEFVALEFTAPEKNRYRYILEGFEPAWVEAGLRREVTYTSLPAGDYTFRVTGSNGDGVWNNEGTALRITVNPPYWNTWWFRTLVSVGLFGVVYLIYRVRTHNLQDRASVLQLEVDRRRQTEKALVAAEVKYRSIFERSLYGIFQTTPEGRFLSANLSMAKMLGYESPEQLIQSVTNIGETLYVNPGDREALQKRLRISKEVRDFACRARTRDGSIIIVLQNVRLVRDPETGADAYEGMVENITDRMIAEQQLKDSEHQFRSLFENAVLGIYRTTPDGNILAVNKALCDMLGYANPEDLKSRNLEKDGFDPSYPRADFKRQLGKMDTIIGLESVWKKADGTSIFVRENATVARDSSGAIVYYEGTVENISERKQMERQLRESEEHYRSLVDTSPDAIAMIDADGKVTFASKRCHDFFGVPENESFGGSSVLEWAPPDEKERLQRHLSDLLSGKADLKSREYRLQRRDQTHFWCDISSSPLVAENGAIRGLLFNIHDISVRKEAEEQRKKLELQLFQAQRLESIGTLASGIAHDFNNILNIILGNVNLLSTGKSSQEKTEQRLNAILSASERGAQVVKQLLAFARKTGTSRVLISINDAIFDASKLLEETIPKSINVTLELESHLPNVFADPNQIHQVLLNMSINARDAMPAGGKLTFVSGLLKGDELRLKFPRAASSSYVCFSVKDTGVGMDEATRSRVFDPFFTTKEIGKGTGLGLAVVLGIIENHQGFIDVMSEPGAGTTFNIYLPSVEEQSDVHARGMVERAADFGGNETILFIEDELLGQEAAVDFLTSFGYTVITAVDGEEGVELFKANRKSISIVLSDYGLPKLDGGGVYSRIKDLDPGVRFILMTGYLDFEKRTRLESMGIRVILEKPYKPGQMLQKIREVLDAPQ